MFTLCVRAQHVWRDRHPFWAEGETRMRAVKSARVVEVDLHGISVVLTRRSHKWIIKVPQECILLLAHRSFASSPWQRFPLHVTRQMKSMASQKFDSPHTSCWLWEGKQFVNKQQLLTDFRQSAPTTTSTSQASFRQRRRRWLPPPPPPIS
jgi:hypothetical protein